MATTGHTGSRIEWLGIHRKTAPGLTNRQEQDMDKITDETVAAWSREQNRGVPSWDSLDEAGRAFWRGAYEADRAKSVQS